MSARKVLIFFFVFLDYIPLLAQVDTAWVRYYSGPGNYNDEANAIALDDSGNVYITGFSATLSSSYDYTTIKYTPAGDTIWVVRYDAGGHSEQTAALVAGGNGKLYVTGSSRSELSWTDYATVKYDQNGNILWAQLYNGPGNWIDVATSLAVDDSGNVYVTGSSVVSGKFNSDYATIKYSPNGDTVWLRRYNGPRNASDDAKALAVDGNGNVYVTGGSVDTGTYFQSEGEKFDFATIKYAPNGDTLWVRRYNGPGNNEDKANALALDDSGNVYVTGFTTGLAGIGVYDFTTIKYAPNGETLWVRHYNGPSNFSDEAVAIVVDKSSNVNVTGRSSGLGTFSDYATIKYFPNGDTLWIRRYNQPGGYDARPSSMAVDDSGNVYVTGNSGTIKYLANGDLAWTRSDVAGYAPAISVNDSANVYVTGGTDGENGDYVTIKYVQFACVAEAGDANGDDAVNLQDLIFLVNYIFKGGIGPLPICRGDDNASGGTPNLADIIYLVNYVFKGGPDPLKSRECCLEKL